MEKALRHEGRNQVNIAEGLEAKARIASRRGERSDHPALRFTGFEERTKSVP